MTISAKKFESSARQLAKDIIDYALKQGGGVNLTDVSVSVSMGEEQKNTIEGGDVVSVNGGTWQAVSIALYAEKRVLSFSLNDFDLDTLKDVIDEQLKILPFAPENEDLALLETDKLYKGPKVDLDLYEENQPSQQTLIRYAKDMENAAMSVPKVKTARDISASKGKSFGYRLATNGLDKFGKTSFVQGVTSAVAEDDLTNEMQISYDWSTARHFSDMTPPAQVGKKAGKSAVLKLNAIKPETANMHVVFSPDASANFFSSVFSAISGAAVHTDTTFLKDKIGQQIMNKDVTIIDDPRTQRGLSSQFTDNAGQESKAITFIKNGILQTYLLGMVSARQLGLEPIGRSGGKTNVQVLPGKVTVEDLIQDIEEGIYVLGFQGGSVSATTKQFSRPAHGLLIKDGKITDQAVSGFVVAGNLDEMYMDVRLANDTPSLPYNRGSFVAPTARINALKIAGA